MSQTGTSQSQNGSCWDPNGKRCSASSYKEDECWSSVGEFSAGARHHQQNCRWWWHLKYCVNCWKTQLGFFFSQTKFSHYEQNVCELVTILKLSLPCNFFQPILNWNDFGKISLYCILLIYWRQKIISSSFNIIKGDVIFKMFSEKWMAQQWKNMPWCITE